MKREERTLTALDLALVIQHREKSDEENPHYLNKEKSTELLQLIGQAMATEYPDIAKSGLIGVGSIYHLNQIIRPNFPLFTQLFELAKIRFRPNNFKPAIIGIGTDQPHFEIDLFNRESTDFKEVLQVLPLLSILPNEPESVALFEELERSLITKTHLSQTLVTFVEREFNIEVENISLVTLGDLNGLFASQLIQIGLEELWNIMQAVIFNLDELITTLGSGHTLYWKHDEVAILLPHQSIYSEAMKDYNQSYEMFQLTTRRLTHLFKTHKIPYQECTLFNPQLFQKEITIEKAKEALNQHIKAL